MKGVPLPLAGQAALPYCKNTITPSTLSNMGSAGCFLLLLQRVSTDTLTVCWNNAHTNAYPACLNLAFNHIKISMLT